MRQALATYTTRAAEKLRAEGMQAGQISVFVHTNRFNQNETQYSGSRAVQIEPTSGTGQLIGEVVRLLKAIWRQGFRYAKAGVMLNDLASSRQASMFMTRAL